MVLSNIDNSIFSKIFWTTLLFKQNKYHKYGVLLHTLKVVLGVLKARDFKFLAAAIFHDIGKPFVAYQDDEDILVDEYSFTDHEERSYRIVKNWLIFSDWTKNVIRYHYIIRDIENSKRKGLLDRLARLEKAYATLDDDFIKELEKFLLYDDYGKQ